MVEEGVGPPGTVIMGGCELPDVFLGAEPSPQEELQMLLASEPSL